MAEMFVTHVVRRAMEFNKHESMWEYGPELAANFRMGMRPQIDLMAQLLTVPSGVGTV